MELTEFNKLVDSYYESIYRFCYHLLAQISEAEDAVQNIFLKIYQAKQTPSLDSEVKSWIYTIAKNECKDRFRWWKRYNLFKTNKSNSLENDFIKPTELLEEISTIVNNLPEKQKLVFILRHWHGFSTSETAKMLEVDEGTIKTHLKRSIDKVKMALRNKDLVNLKDKELDV